MPYSLAFPQAYDSVNPVNTSESARLGAQRIDEVKWFIANVFGLPDGKTLNGAQHWLTQFADFFSDMVISGILGTVPASSLTMTIPTGVCYANGRRVVVASAGDTHTYGISSDTYVDVDQYGVFTYTPVANGSAAPAVAANSVRTQKVVTDGTKIVSIADLRTLPLTKGTPATKQYVDTAATPPTGLISAYGGSSAPAGWLLCDGSAVSRTTYATLFGIIGTAYGAGDGSTTFNVPDLRGRSPLGSGTGTGLTPRTIGDTGGEESHALTLNENGPHTHTATVTDPGHVHDVNCRSLGDNLASSFATRGDSSGAGTGTISSAASLKVTSITVSNASSGLGTAHNTMHPFTVCAFIIKT